MNASRKLMGKSQLRLFVDRVIHSRYKIINEIGKGGMGAVFEAVDLTSDRRVAIKQTAATDPSLMAAAKREAALLAGLNYPQVPRLLDHFEEETGNFLVMQFVPGPTLGQLLAARQLPFSPNQVRLWAKDLLHTLAYLHGRTPAVIHNDIKPANLKLLPDGSVVLLDFGLAQVVDASDADELSDTLLAYTPNYAPPEQIMGLSTGPCSDIYSLGATLYHLLTGRVPADSLKRSRQVRSSGADPLEPITKIIRGVPQPLAQLITKALSLEPEQRPESATEMLDQLATNLPIFTGVRTTVESQTTVAPKAPVLSGRRERITVDIQPPDFKQRQVVSLIAYREAKERVAARRRKTATALTNIASAFAILFTVASLSTYIYKDYYDRHPGSWRNEILAEQPSTQTVNRIDPISARNLPTESVTLDQLVRWKARTIRREQRMPASRSYAHPSATVFSAVPGTALATPF